MAAVTGPARPATAPVPSPSLSPATPASKARPAPRRAATPANPPGPAAEEVPASAVAPPSWTGATSTPVPAPAASAGRPGSILRQVETQPVTSWLSSQAELHDEPPPAGPPPAIPGAYLAPSAAFSAAVPNPRSGRAAVPIGAARPGLYAQSATGAVSPVAFAPIPGASPASARSPGLAAKAAGVSVQAPTELPGWLAIAGSAIAAVSFLMPWSRDGVIGAVGSGYFDRWGLANPGYLPLVVIALILLAINGVPNPVAGWVRAGLAPLAVGGVLFGLDWAYQTRPYSDGLGVTLLLVSALVLMIGGVLGVRSGRHPATPPLV